MDRLGVNTAICVSAFLDLKSVYSFLRCSRRFFAYWSEAALWSSILHRESRPLVTLTCDPQFTIKDCYSFKAYLHAKFPVNSPRDFLISLLEVFDRVSVVPLRGVAESSHAPDQSISNTVSPSENFRWASLGSTLCVGTEFLRYVIPSGPVVLFWVGVRLYRDFVGSGYIYAPYQYRLKIGVEEGVWDYTSETIAAEVTESVQYLILLPRIVVGRYIQIDLIGRVERSPLNSQYYLAVEKVICAGLPAAVVQSTVSLDVSAIEPAVSLETYPAVAQRYIDQPWLVRRDTLDKMRHIGKLESYLRSRLESRFKKLTKIESCYIAECFPHLPVATCSQFTDSEELGDVLFARGEVSKAYRIFSSRLIAKKTAMCLMTMKAFGQCVALLDTSEYYDMPTIRDLRKMAKHLGEDVEREFEEYLRR